MTLDCRSTSWLNEFSMAHDAASSAMGSASRTGLDAAESDVDTIVAVA